jgi:Uma2 family endonuclease
VLYVANGRSAILTEANVQGAPTLVVEIVSQGTRKRDERIKWDLFARSGVREYWLVYPDAGAIAIDRRQADGSWTRLVELTAAGGDALTTPLLPGFSLALADFFAPSL